MTVDNGDRELLDSGDSRTGLVRLRWASVPRRRRLLASMAAVLVVATVAGWVGAAHLRAYLHERSLRDQVTLSATVEVSASSTSLGGGRVDYFLAVRNLGPREVRISEAQLGDARLHVVSRNFATLTVPGGTTVDIPISVRLECLDVGADGPGRLHGTVSATPQSGRERAVPTTLAQTSLVTDVADTLCRVRPGLRGRELSGAVT